MKELPATQAEILLDTDRVVGEISPLLFGGFAEHLGRCVYGGIYEPESLYADGNGFRRDVLAALREMNLSVMRYPGGNFVSGYDWRDGVGPKAQRPVRRDLAWQSLETNQFGTDEFMALCRTLGCEPMLGMNFGTGTIGDALALVEYCNAPVGTAWADLRARNGHREPYGVKYWCLGNEMDGPWQIGHLSADQYAAKAREAGKIIRWHDRSSKLILCGSSNPNMSSYPEWDRVALEACWDQIDYLSLHNYATNWENDTPSFLAYATELEAQVDTLAATLRFVKAKLRSKKDVHLCWDEWNVWYKNRDAAGGWRVAPPLCEEVYNLEDALVVAQWLSVLLRRCDVVKIACIAQVVNALAPLLTTPVAVLKQATFYPFVLFRRFASGISLDPLVRCATYETRRFGVAPLIDASATFDPSTGRRAVFLVNRSQSDTIRATVRWQGRESTAGHRPKAWMLSGRDPKQTNTFEAPQALVPVEMKVDLRNDELPLALPPLSFTAVQI